MTEEELTDLRDRVLRVKELRADLDTDFPVGAVARGKWQEDRRAMADACPRLLALIDAQRVVLEAFIARQADLKPLLYDEFSKAHYVLAGNTDV